MIRFSTNSLKHSILLSYAFPAAVLAFPTIPIYLYLPSFYGIELGVGLATTGVLLMVGRFFDTISDPLIGILSDRYKIGKGLRKPWIAVGAVIAAVGFYKIFHPPEEELEKFLLLWSIVLYAGWTMISVPYLAWGAELSSDYNERTRITSWRESFGLTGIIIVGVMILVMSDLELANRDIMANIAIIALSLGSLAIPLLLWVVPDTVIGGRLKKKALLVKENIKSGGIFYNQLFLRLLSAWFCNGLANGIPAALFLIYLEHSLLAGPEIRAILILIYFVAAICAIPVWLYLSSHFGKHRTWCFAMIIACIAFIIVPLMPERSFILFGLICFVTGSALGADLILPPAMQADVVDYDRLKFSSERVGQQFAFWGMATKFALAISVGLSLPVIGYFGFDPSSPTISGVQALTLIYAVLPVVLKIITIFTIWNFPLTNSRQSIIRKRLARRKSF